MANNDDLKKLDMRIARMEKLVETLVTRAEPTEISADEMETYKKVRDVVAVDWGHFCGINDCFRCIVQPCVARCVQTCIQACIKVCDVECSCGPCSIGGLQGNMRRFDNLG
jgi:hypothetical protein